MIEGGLWDTCRNVYPAIGGVENISKMQWRFPSGAKVGFGYISNDKDLVGKQGAQIPLIGFDELTHFSAHQFFYMLSRNRSMCGVLPYVRATCNPDPDSFVAGLIEWWIEQDSDSPNYGLAIPDRSGVIRWFLQYGDAMHWGDSRQELIDTFGDSPEIIPKSFTFIPASVYDNKILLKGDPGYLGNLMALQYVERMRLLRGNWKIRAGAGSLFKREWFEIVEHAPAKLRTVRYWDRAATEPKTENPDPDWTAGVKMGVDKDGQYYILDCVRFRTLPLAVRQNIYNIAQQDGRSVYRICLEQDPGQAGKVEVGDLIRYLKGFNVRAFAVDQNKVVRANPLSAQAEVGNVKILRGAWNRDFLDELENFPEGLHDDQVDAASGAFNELSNRKAVWDVNF